MNISTRVAARVLQAKELDLSRIQKIRDLTESNAHSEALVEGAKLLGAKFLEKKLGHVEALVKLERHIPQTLKSYRDTLYHDLMAYAKQELSPSDFNTFYLAY